MTDVITLDLKFASSPETVAVYLVEDGEGGFALFEAGPARCLRRLARAVRRAGFSMSRLRALFLTHIHLDHAGGAGTLARQTGCSVFVHPAGAPHLLDPAAKLIPSARRLYGWRLPFIWGRMEAVPRDQLTVSEHGRTVRVGALEVTGWHTPGHARHHVAWQIGGDVVTGDVAGIRFPGSRYVTPPMPPPDIDVEQWCASLRLILGLDPQRLLLTHFGPFTDVGLHLEQLEDRIVRWAELARDEFRAGADAKAIGRRLLALDDRDADEAGVPSELVARGRRMCAIDDSAAGLLRYWRNRPPTGD